MNDNLARQQIDISEDIQDAVGSGVMPRFAGPGRRLCAAAVDLILVSIISVEIYLVCLPGIRKAVSLTAANANYTGFFAAAVLVAVVAVPWLIYYAGFESSSWQATPGKKLLGIRVMGLEGEDITSSVAALRLAAKYVFAALGMGFLLAMPLLRSHIADDHWLFGGDGLVHAVLGVAAVCFLGQLLSLAMILFSRNRQSFHDLLTCSVVVERLGSISREAEAYRMRKMLESNKTVH